MITNDFENLKLLGFTPITDSTSENLSPLSQYYKDNMLEASNAYMQKLLEPITTPESIVQPTKSNSFTLEMLNNITKKNSTLPISNPYFTIPGSSTQTSFNFTPTKNVNEKGKQVISFFVQKGLTKEQAAGIAGNLHEESKFKTTALGDNDTSYGIAQWHNERWVGLQNFARTQGKSSDDFTTQLEYLWKELNTTETGALKALKSTKSVTEAARTFAHTFERMKTYNASREHVANKLYNI